MLMFCRNHHIMFIVQFLRIELPHGPHKIKIKALAELYSFLEALRESAPSPFSAPRAALILDSWLPPSAVNTNNTVSLCMRLSLGSHRPLTLLLLFLHPHGLAVCYSDVCLSISCYLNLAQGNNTTGIKIESLNVFHYTTR